MKEYFSTCPICNSENLQKLKGYELAYLVKCKSCTFTFSSKIPTEQNLINHYKNYSPNARLSEITLKRYNELLDKLEKFRKTNNILDLGCGEGFFLQAAKKRKWNVFGTEYREDIIRKCSEKGINMRLGKLSGKDYSIEQFDVITSFEVIEHINNPQEEMATCNAILRKGGAIYLTTPNFNSLSRILLRDKWNVIEYPEHLSYYTPRTLDKLLSSSNYRNSFLKTTGISLSRFRNSIHNKSTNSSDENFRIKAEKNILFAALKLGLNTLLSLSRKGDTIKALYFKQ